MLDLLEEKINRGDLVMISGGYGTNSIGVVTAVDDNTLRSIRPVFNLNETKPKACIKVSTRSHRTSSYNSRIIKLTDEHIKKLSKTKWFGHCIIPSPTQLGCVNWFSPEYDRIRIIVQGEASDLAKTILQTWQTQLLTSGKISISEDWPRTLRAALDKAKAAVFPPK